MIKILITYTYKNNLKSLAVCEFWIDYGSWKAMLPLKFEDYSLPKLEVPGLKLVGDFPMRKTNEF